MASEEHRKGDVSVKIIAKEGRKTNRKWKEGIAIKNLQPTLNEDDGLYKLAPIFSLISGPRRNPSVDRDNQDKESRDDVNRAPTEAGAHFY